MPRVVPSRVIGYIHKAFGPNPAGLNELQLNRANIGELAGLLSLVEQIPDELLTMTGEDYAAFVTGAGHIHETLRIWANARAVEATWLSRVPAYQQHPIKMIYDALSTCSDEAPASAKSELNFVFDPELRANLRNDIGAVSRALTNGEWKAATVLAGSVIEALLLWALHNRKDINTEISHLRSTGVLRKGLSADLERWDLSDYIDAAEALKVIKPDTVSQTTLAKDFRNLIHPGRVQRFKQECRWGTALAAIAGMDLVIRDLS